jgi:hypothetical protein
VPLANVVEVSEFPSPRDGPVLFIRPKDGGARNTGESMASVVLEVEVVEALVAMTCAPPYYT